MENNKKNKKIIRCYSDKYIMRLYLKKPFIRFENMNLLSYYYFPIPFFLISKILNKVSIILQKSRIFLHLIYILQKPISLYEQQTYISKMNFTKK